MHHYRGQAALARATADALMARAERTRNLQQKAWSLRCLALCGLYGGDLDEATTHLETAVDALSGSHDLNEVVPAWAALGLARWRQGDRQRALPLALRALDSSAGRPTGHSTLEGCSAIVEVLFASSEDPHSAEARHLMGRCLRILRHHQRVFPISRPRYLLWKGQRDWLLGKERSARARWREGLAAAEALGMGLDVGLLRRKIDH